MWSASSSYFVQRQVVPGYPLLSFIEFLSLGIFPSVSVYGDRNLSALHLPILQLAVLYVKHYADAVKKLYALFFGHLCRTLHKCYYHECLINTVSMTELKVVAHKS